MQLFIFILVIFSLTLVIGLAFSIIFQASKFFNFTLAVIITAAPYFTYLYFIQLQAPIFLAIPLAIISAVAVGLLAESALFNPLRKRNASSVALMLSSLGFYIVLQNAISMIWGDRVLSIRTAPVRAGHEFWGVVISNTQIVTIAVCFVVFIACVLFMKYSRIGRNIRAVASNSELSNIVGISSDRVILWAYGIGSVLVGIVGILIAYDTDMRPIMGFNWFLYGAVAMIIGGVGSIWGLAGGAFLLVSIQYLIAYFFGTMWMEPASYALLILFLIIRPLGFSGKKLKKVEI